MKVKISKKVQAANKLFNSLSPAKRRVAIAKDVILQLNRGVFQAAQQTYVEFQNHNLYDLPEDKEACTVPASQMACHCCARGAIFVSRVRTFDNCKMKDFVEPVYAGCGETSKEERKFFTKDQIGLIESLFEGDSTFASDRYDDNPNWFYYNATLPENPSDRMKAIMKNIVDNDGLCKLPRAPKDFVKGFKDLLYINDKQSFAYNYINS